MDLDPNPVHMVYVRRILTFLQTKNVLTESQKRIFDKVIKTELCSLKNLKILFSLRNRFFRGNISLIRQSVDPEHVSTMQATIEVEQHAIQTFLGEYKEYYLKYPVSSIHYLKYPVSSILPAIPNNSRRAAWFIQAGSDLPGRCYTGSNEMIDVDIAFRRCPGKPIDSVGQAVDSPFIYLLEHGGGY